MRLIFCITFLVIFPVLLFGFFKRGEGHQPNLESTTEPDLSVYPESALLLSEYVQIESISGNELKAGQFMADFCRSRGLYVEVFTDEIDSYNFAASLYPLSLEKPNIILLNHIDVVPADDSLSWTYPPFSGTIADGNIWGRGAYDSKGLGVMQLFSILQFVERAQTEDLPYNITLLCVSGEETGGEKGAEIVVNNFLEELNPVVVYGEGGAGVRGVSRAYPDRPFFGITTSQKHILWWELKTQTPSTGHGSVPMNTNATRELIMAVQTVMEKNPPLRFSPISKEMLREVGRNEYGLRGFILRNIGIFHPFIGKMLRQDPLIAALLTNTTTLLGVNSTTGASNQIAPEAVARFDSRLLPGTCNEKFIADIKKKIRKYDVELEVIRQYPDSPASETGYYYDVFEEAVKRSYEDAVVLPMIFLAHDDNYYFRLKDIPTYGLVPVILNEEILGAIHNIDERIPIATLEKGIEVYVELLTTLLYAMKIAK